jgi:hypothetical protein
MVLSISQNWNQMPSFYYPHTWQICTYRCTGESYIIRWAIHLFWASPMSHTNVSCQQSMFSVAGGWMHCP